MWFLECLKFNSWFRGSGSKHKFTVDKGVVMYVFIVGVDYLRRSVENWQIQRVMAWAAYRSRSHHVWQACHITCTLDTDKDFFPGAWRIIPWLGYVVNNHGDRFRPLRIGLWDPFQMAIHGWNTGGVILTTYYNWGAHPPKWSFSVHRNLWKLAIPGKTRPM